MRNICVCLEFLTEERCAAIRKTAESLGFSVRFFTLEQQAEALAFAPDCEVLFAHDPELVRAAANLNWFHCAWAGVDAYCRDESLFANPACLFTNNHSYGTTIAEHVILVTLMLLRRMPEYQSAMARKHWLSPLPIRSIRGSRFTLLGAGDISRHVARRLRAMEAARVTAVSRSGRPQPDFDAVVPITKLDDILPETDVLIMALPGTAETAGILSRERMALLPEGACVINVGRGAAMDQTALCDALNTGHLGGAALDVMVPEPLPEDSPLWSAKNLILTPHVSGSTNLPYTCDLTVELFCRNLHRYAAGERLEGLVDRTSGY